MILLIDNYDSFVYNLARYVNELDFDCIVKRNDEITLSEIGALNPSHIILSPGPCTPNEAGISLDLVKQFYKTIPIFGVCLGHQAIGQAFGAKIVKAKKPMHGKPSLIWHDKKDLFSALPSPFSAARYHSLVVDSHYFPYDLEILAKSEEDEVMALRHKDYPVFGVQFHPESILTEQDYGYVLLRQFL